MSYQLYGKMPSTLGKGTLAESKGGALLYYMMVHPDGRDDVPEVRGMTCLVKKDGTLMQRNVENLIAILGGLWDGTNPAALEEIDPSGIQVLAEYADTDPDPVTGKVFTDVKNIYPLNGGGQALPEAVDAKSVAAKYGSQFRAAFGKATGATATKPKAPPPVKTPTTKAPPAAAPTTEPSQAAPSTLNDVWAAYWAQHNEAGEDDNAIQLAWTKEVKTRFNCDQVKVTPAQWGEFLAELTSPTPF